MNVRRLYRNDGARKFSEVEGGLNKIGIRSFIRMVKDVNLKIEYFKVIPVKGLTPLIRIPFVNELFAQDMVAVLRS